MAPAQQLCGAGLVEVHLTHTLRSQFLIKGSQGGTQSRDDGGKLLSGSLAGLLTGLCGSAYIAKDHLPRDGAAHGASVISIG